MYISCWQFVCQMFCTVYNKQDKRVSDLVPFHTVTKMDFPAQVIRINEYIEANQNTPNLSQDIKVQA